MTLPMNLIDCIVSKIQLRITCLKAASYTNSVNFIFYLKDKETMAKMSSAINLLSCFTKGASGGGPKYLLGLQDKAEENA